MTFQFIVGSDIRSWTTFELKDATPEEIEILSREDDDSIAFAKALYEADSDRLIEGGTEYDDNPDIFADYATPAILDCEVVGDE